MTTRRSALVAFGAPADGRSRFVIPSPTQAAQLDTEGLVDPSTGNRHLRNSQGQVTSFTYGGFGTGPAGYGPMPKDRIPTLADAWAR